MINQEGTVLVMVCAILSATGVTVSITVLPLACPGTPTATVPFRIISTGAEGTWGTTEGTATGRAEGAGSPEGAWGTGTGSPEGAWIG